MFHYYRLWIIYGKQVNRIVMRHMIAKSSTLTDIWKFSFQSRWQRVHIIIIWMMKYIDLNRTNQKEKICTHLSPPPLSDSFVIWFVYKNNHIFLFGSVFFLFGFCEKWWEANNTLCLQLFLRFFFSFKIVREQLFFRTAQWSSVISSLLTYGNAFSIS